MRILIAEDEKDLNHILVQKLTQDGYSVDSCYDGQEAMDILTYTKYDAVILDIMMPKADGFTVLRALRGMGMGKTTPVLFLTAKDAVSDRVKGLDSGANDYLVKPFSYMELLSRVKALIRRYKVYQGRAETSEELVCYRDITIDQNLQMVQAGGEKISLTEMEYQILLLLISNPRKVFSVKEIYETVWKEAFFPNSGNTVMVHIRNIRRKLEKGGQSYIQNIWGRGYCVN